MPTHYRGTPRERLALDAYIKLLRATGTVNAALGTPLQVKHKLTFGQLGVLESLLYLGPLTPTQLSGKLLTRGSNLTTVLDNLEKREWITRTRSTNDRRVFVVTLTAKGRRAIESIFPKHAARIAQLMGVLTAKEQAQLASLTRKLGLGATKRAR